MVQSSNMQLRYALMVCLLMSLLWGCAGTAQKSGAYIDDSVITTKVKSKLLADKTVSGMAVNVETVKGVVQLSGFVKDAAQKRQAERLAESTNGVQRVINSIQIKP